MLRIEKINQSLLIGIKILKEEFLKKKSTIILLLYVTRVLRLCRSERELKKAEKLYQAIG